MSLVIYGLGSTGKAVVEQLIVAGTTIDLILDRGKAGESFGDIPVRALGDLDDGALTGKTALIALHNHYVDLHDIDEDLRRAGAAEVLTLVDLPRLVPSVRLPEGYWLDPTFDYDRAGERIARMRSLLADERSRTLFDQIIRYRRSGKVADCPKASLADEYVPVDLPRYAEPLRLVDCGAFTGVAIHKFLKAGYAIDRVIAFEPDPKNFAILSRRDFAAQQALCLPLGTWSSTTQLKFASDGSMASQLSQTGDVTIQCVAIDDVLGSEPVNLIKLDVEGAEIETLLGARRMIEAQRPNLLVSAYHTPGHLFEIAELIASWNLGYRFHLRVHEQNTFGVVVYALQDALIDR